MSTAALLASSSSLSAPKQQPIFQFTKRKHWVDLLITELADALILILSDGCKVLYCGRAVSELLGWQDHELIDGDLFEIIDPQDHVNFRRCFDHSVRTSSEFTSFIHLKSKSNSPDSSERHTNSQAILFELNGKPIADSCFLVVAKSYPSRNATMLNTFLELKTENERLQQQVMQYKTRTIPSSSSSRHPVSSMLFPQTSKAPFSFPQPADISNPYYTRPGAIDWNDQLTTGSFDHGINLPSYEAEIYSSASTSPTDDEDSSRRKKLKMSHTLEQYVCITCGRTDSPEWRKGPLGPKTLCNACGLRWAKQMRKTDDSVDSVGEIGLLS